MSFASSTGYLPNTIEQIMDSVMTGVNTQFGTAYTTETFLGTNFYKYFYALAQRMQENEIKTSEIFLRMQEYFVITNEEIRRPNTTRPGILDILADAGYTASVKAPIDADAGKAYVCVDVDNISAGYATRRLAVCNIIKNCIVAGVVSQGTEVETITLSNSQSFDFKFNLPTKTAIKLKLTITLSDNNQYTILSDADVKALLYANINAKYHLGMNFEPQRYFSILDAPWAETVLLQYSLDGGSTWLSAVAVLAYNVVYTFALSDITIVNV